jgi:hypothetical protein
MVDKKEINLEEKLKKLIPVTTKKEKKESEKKEPTKQDKETKTDEKKIVFFEQKEKASDQNTLPPVIEEIKKKETLEESILDSSTNNVEKESIQEIDIIKYGHGKEPVVGKYQNNNGGSNVSQQYNSGIKNVGKIITRETDVKSNANLTNNRRANPMNPFSRDITNYEEAHLNGTKKYDGQDSMNKYEETERQFYETSRRDIREKI